MRLVTFALLATLAFALHAQEFKPYPRARITAEQWQAYFDEVSTKYASSRREFPGEHLVVFEAADSYATYAFTQPGHPAHPAWVTRQPVQDNVGVQIRQIGYFAGEEAPFAQMFRQYQELNARIREDFKNKSTAVTPAQDAKTPGSVSATVPEEVVAASNKDSDWRPTPSQVSLVQAQTISYFSARDSGRLDEAYAKFSPTQKETVPFEAWHASIEGFNAKAGPVTARALRKITWYKDPPDGRLGVYAAVDFSSEFPNLALHCGYVVWHQQPDGSFAVVREEDNFIDRPTAAKLKPGDLERIRAQFRC
jgi:hypothetical protein